MIDPKKVAAFDQLLSMIEHQFVPIYAKAYKSFLAEGLSVPAALELTKQLIHSMTCAAAEGKQQRRNRDDDKK